jgi:hypothetical protein
LNDLPPPDSDQRAIDSLSERSGVPVAKVRALFARELARLELGATVRSYLSVLAAASVRGMLSRAGVSLRTVAKRVRLSQLATPEARELADWENEGGTTAEPSTAVGV